MIHVKRKQPSNIGTYLLPFILMGLTFGLSFYVIPSMAFVPTIDPDTYMKLIPVGGISLMVLVYGFTFLTNPTFGAMRAERRAFTQKHGQLTGTGMKWLFVVSVLLTLIPLAFIGDLDRWKWFIENRNMVMAIWGAIGLIPLGLGGFLMHRSTANMLAFVNKEIPDTKLNLGHANVSRRGGMMSFDGQFRGREIAYEGEAGTEEHMYGKTTLKVKMSDGMPVAFADLHVTDRKPLWRSYKGATVDEVFEKRFEISGAEIGNLPEAFKNVMVRLPWSVRMEFHKDEFVFIYEEATSIGTSPPFYSFHGMVLFLDGMSEVADSIAE